MSHNIDEAPEGQTFNIDPTGPLTTTQTRVKALKAARQAPNAVQNSGFLGPQQRKAEPELSDDQITSMRRKGTGDLKRATGAASADASIDLEPKTEKERIRRMMGPMLTMGMTIGLGVLLLGAVGFMISGMIGQYEGQNTLASAKSFLKQGNASLAHRHLEPLKANGSREPEVYALMGSSSLRLHKSEDALKEFDQASKLAVKDPAPICGKAEAFLQMNKPDDAVTEANAALALRPDFPDALRLRAAAYTMKGEYQKSLDDADAYLKANGQAPADLYATRGKDLTELKRYADAAKDYAMAVQIEPGNGPYWVARAEALKNSKQYKEAVLASSGAIGVLGKQPELLRFRSDCHVLNGSLDLAIQDYELVCQLARKKDDYARCGDLAMLDKRYNLASFYFGKALEEDRDDNSVRTRLDQARQGAGLVPKVKTKKE